MAKSKENMSFNVKMGFEQFWTLYLHRTSCLVLQLEHGEEIAEDNLESRVQSDGSAGCSFFTSFFRIPALWRGSGECVYRFCPI